MIKMQKKKQVETTLEVLLEDYPKLRKEFVKKNWDIIQDKDLSMFKIEYYRRSFSRIMVSRLFLGRKTLAKTQFRKDDIGLEFLEVKTSAEEGRLYSTLSALRALKWYAKAAKKDDVIHGEMYKGGLGVLSKLLGVTMHDLHHDYTVGSKRRETIMGYTARPVTAIENPIIEINYKKAMGMIKEAWGQMKRK